MSGRQIVFYIFVMNFLVSLVSGFLIFLRLTREDWVSSILATWQILVSAGLVAVTSYLVEDEERFTNLSTSHSHLEETTHEMRRERLSSEETLGSKELTSENAFEERVLRKMQRNGMTREKAIKEIKEEDRNE